MRYLGPQIRRALNLHAQVRLWPDYSLWRYLCAEFLLKFWCPLLCSPDFFSWVQVWQVPRRYPRHFPALQERLALSAAAWPLFSPLTTRYRRHMAR